MQSLRYPPITDRLQSLYAHQETTTLMHSYNPSTCGKLLHPCDGEAWQQFDVDFLDLAMDKRNVKLSVAIDGFTPFNINDAPYSCWTVFVTPQNLPPGTLLWHEYIFLSLVFLGHEHPGKKLNIGTYSPNRVRSITLANMNRCSRPLVHCLCSR